MILRELRLSATGIVPKRVYGETVLKDGDVLEIVSFVGGG